MTISGTTSDAPEFEQLVATCGARLRAKVREARWRARVAAEAAAEAEAFSGVRETPELLAQAGLSSESRPELELVTSDVNSSMPS